MAAGTALCSVLWDVSLSRDEMFTRAFGCAREHRMGAERSEKMLEDMYGS